MQFVGALLLLIGTFIGMKFADFDIAFRWKPLLEHRSLLTHSFLLPLLLTQLLTKDTEKESRIRCFLIGICLGMAVHLCFDLFPRAWTGYSLIHIPFYGRTPVLFSIAWILGNIATCFYIAYRIIWSINEFFLSLLGLILAYSISASAQPRSWLFALLILAVAVLTSFPIARLAYRDKQLGAI